MLLLFDINECEKVMDIMVNKHGFNLDQFETDDVMNIGTDLDDIATIVNIMNDNGLWFKLVVK